MIAAKLEERIIAALGTALAVHAPGMARPAVVRGFWQMAAEGRIGAETRPVGAVLHVSVGAPAYETSFLPKARYACSISATFKSASSVAAATTVVPVCNAIVQRLGAWQADLKELEEDLGFDVFRPIAITVAGGPPPVPEDSADEWRVNIGFTITGVED